MTRQIKLGVGLALGLVTALAVAFVVFSFTSTAAATQNNAPAQVQPQSQNHQAAQEPSQEPAQATSDQTQDDLAQFTDDQGDFMAAAQPMSGTMRPGRGGFGGPMMGGMSIQAGPELQDTISKVENGGAKLTLGQRVVNLNDQTVVGDANGTLQKSDLKVGDRITALGKIESDKSLTARWVLRLPALPTAQRGTVSSVDASSFKFKTGDNTEWTVTTNDQTAFNKSGQSVKLSDLKAGDSVVVVGQADNSAKTITASRVQVGNLPGPGRGPVPPNRGNFTGGTVKNLDTAGNSFVISETQGSNTTDIKVTVDSNTRYVGDLKALSDLKAGDKVQVVGQKQADGSLKATAVLRGPMRGKGRTGSTDNGFMAGGMMGFSEDHGFMIFAGDANDQGFSQQN